MQAPTRQSRSTLPAFLLFAAVLPMASALVGCANRGMKPPTRDGGPTGSAGTGGRGGGGGSGGMGGMDAGCPGPPANVDAGACTAKFGFDTGSQGATIPTTGQAAFTAVTTGSTQTFCGPGALAITASFSGMSGNTTKGVVEIPVPTADMDFTGKTVTVHYMAVPGCSPDLGVAIALQTDVGDKIILPTFRPVTSMWKTSSVTLTGDAGVVGMDTVRGISIQAFSSSSYQGTIYVDEISVTGP